MAFPQSIEAGTPLTTDSPSFGDDHLRSIKSFIVDVFGITNAATYTSAAFSISTTGVVTMVQAGFTIPQVVITAGTKTDQFRLVDGSITWNSGSISFDSIRMQITDTTSSTDSHLIQMVVDGNSKFSVYKTGVIHAGTWQATRVAEIYGGTGKSSYTTGQILYADDTDSLARLSAGATAGMFLRSQGTNTAPQWSTLVLPNAISAQQIMIGTATNTVGALSTGSSSQILQGGSPPTWVTFSVTNPSVTSIAVSGTSSFSGSMTAATISATVIRAGASAWAATGDIRMPNDGAIYCRNAANSGDLRILTMDSSNIIRIGSGSTTRSVALPTSMIIVGSGGTASLGQITGAPGPTLAAQAGWMEVRDNAGTQCFLPAWF